MDHYAGIWIDRHKAVLATLDRSGAVSVRTILPEGGRLGGDPFRPDRPTVEDVILDRIARELDESIADDIYPADQVFRLNQCDRREGMFRDDERRRWGRFLDRVASAVSSAKSIAIFGPDEARQALGRAFRRTPALRRNLLAVECSETLTDEEFVRFLRRYFGVPERGRPLPAPEMPEERRRHLFT